MIYIAVDMCQFHFIFGPVRHLHLGLLTEIILIPYTLFNLFKYSGGKKLLIWRFMFTVSISPGLLFGFASHHVLRLLIMELTRFFSGLVTICLVIKTLTDFTKLIQILIATSFLMSIFVITHNGHGPGLLDDENDVASVLVMLLPISFFLTYLTTSSIKKYALYFVFLLTLAAIAATFSRGGMVGTLPTLAFIWLNSKRKILSLCFLILAIIGAVLFGPPNLLHEFSTIKDVNDGTAAGRIYFWQVSIELFKKFPLFGVGAHGWGNAIWNGAVPLQKSIINSTPHSIYFQLLSEIGLFGTIVFIIFVFHLVLTTRNIFFTTDVLQKMSCNYSDYNRYETIKRYTQSIIIGLIGFAICSIFISTLYYPHLYYYIFFIQVLSNIVTRDKNDLMEKKLVEIRKNDQVT